MFIFYTIIALKRGFRYYLTWGAICTYLISFYKTMRHMELCKASSSSNYHFDEWAPLRCKKVFILLINIHYSINFLLFLHHFLEAWSFHPYMSIDPSWFPQQESYYIPYFKSLPSSTFSSSLCFAWWDWEIHWAPPHRLDSSLQAHQMPHYSSPYFK